MGPQLSALVVSDNQLTATKIRTALLGAGVECPHSCVVSLALGVEVAAKSPPDLLFVAMSGGTRMESALKQLRSRVASAIIGVGAASSPKEVLDAIHAGADDYLTECDTFVPELESLLHRVRSKRSQEHEKCYTIAVTSAVGGSGASTIAANLAAAIAQRQQRCVLLDLQMPVGDQMLLLNLQPRYSLADICQHDVELDEATFAQLLTRHECGIELLSAGGVSGEEQRASSEVILKIVQLAQAACPYVVIDFSCSEADATVRLAQTSDVIAMVVRLDVVALLKTKRVIEQLASAGIDDERIVLIANRCGQPNEIASKLAEKSIGRKFAHQLPDDVKIVNASVNMGLPAVLGSPTAKISKGLRKVCDDLLSGSQRQGHPAAVRIAAATGAAFTVGGGSHNQPIGS